MSVGSRIFRGAAWVTIANFLARIGTFTANMIVVRMLSLEQLGQLGLIESWLSLVGMFSLLGLSVATTRYIARYLESDTGQLGEIAGVALLLVTGVSLLAGALFVAGVALAPLERLNWGQGSLIVETQQFVETHMALVFGYVVVAALRETGLALVQGMQVFRVLVYLNIVTGILSLPLYYAGARAAGVAGVLGARLALLLLEFLLALAFARIALRRLGSGFLVRRIAARTKQLVSFAVPTFAGQLAANPAKTFLTSVLAAQPGGATQVGLLTTAGRLVGLASFPLGSMASVLMPILSTVWGTGERHSFRYGVVTALRMMWLVTLPVVLFCLVAAPALLGWLYGPEYVAAATVTAIVLVTTLINTVNETSERTLAAANQQWLSTATICAGMLVALALGSQLLPRYGASGYATTMLISTALYMLAQLGWLKALFSINLRPLARLFGASLPFLVAGWLAMMIRPAGAQALMAAALAGAAAIVEWRHLLMLEERTALRGFVTGKWSALVSLARRRAKPQAAAR